MSSEFGSAKSASSVSESMASYSTSADPCAGSYAVPNPLGVAFGDAFQILLYLNHTLAVEGTPVTVDWNLPSGWYHNSPPSPTNPTNGGYQSSNISQPGTSGTYNIASVAHFEGGFTCTINWQVNVFGF